MFDGLWTIIFNVMGRTTSLVISIRDNRLAGGNSQYYYLGEAKITGNSLAGDLTGTHYFGNPDPLLGNSTRISLRFKATASGQNMTGQAEIEGPGSICIPFMGTKRA